MRNEAHQKPEAHTGLDAFVGRWTVTLTDARFLARAPVTDQPLPDSIAANVAEWTETNAQFTDAQAERAWQPQDLTWGVFGVREDAIGSPLGDVTGLDVVELGCGTAYFSAQLAMRGARPVGVDPTPAQLATARE